MPNETRELDRELFGSVIVEHATIDLTSVDPATRLDDLGLSGVVRFRVIAAIEAAFGIDFPPDLITALETVEDLTYYTTIKLQHCTGDGGRN